ncbi:MAG TPA: TetR/AcrR family transcriptional regulator [Pseudobdellovibrionaceae bacterium]|jgi:AcrR family transcriptional regulator
MTKRRSISVREPRKEPKQERSRQTYQAILQGAAKIIRKSGVQKFSTNKVAKEAGVSIGSLYQYFPSKEAILAALIDQILAYEYSYMKERFRNFSPEIGAREVFKQVFSYYYITEPEELNYRKIMMDAVAWVNKTAIALKFYKSIAELIVNFTQEHFDSPQSTRDNDAAVFVIQYMLRATIFSSVDKELEKINLEKLIDELAEILMGILRIPTEHRGALPEEK